MKASENVLEGKQTQQPSKRRWGYLIAGTLAMFILGLIYAWSIFAVALDLDRTHSSIIFNTMFVFFCVGSFIASYVSGKFSARVTALVSSLLLAIGFLGMALFTDKGIGIFILFYSICIGTSCGSGYNAILTTVNLWFPERIGFSSGIQLVGFGLSGLILGNVAHQVIERIGIPITFVGIAILGFLILCGFSLFIRIPVIAPETARENAEKNPPTPYLEMLKQPDIILFYIWRTIMLGVCIILVGNTAIDGGALGLSAGAAAILVGVVSVGNTVGRMSGGLLYDRFGFRFLLILATILITVSIFIVTGAFLVHSWVVFSIAATMLGFTYGTLPIATATFSRNRFGPENYSRTMAVTNSNVAIGSMLSMAIVYLGGMLEHQVFSVGGKTTNQIMIYVLTSVFALFGVGAMAAFLKKTKLMVFKQ
ncbi:MAG: MFS transporter [Clostridiales Family XIII bacterium]|jgi:OFA family oxalate/formate antiporter-like MFS transporter|nr:MFS transporter [Clostridiales Family XIII bacterium]